MTELYTILHLKGASGEETVAARRLRKFPFFLKKNGQNWPSILAARGGKTGNEHFDPALVLSYFSFNFIFNRCIKNTGTLSSFALSCLKENKRKLGIYGEKNITVHVLPSFSLGFKVGPGFKNGITIDFKKMSTTSGKSSLQSYVMFCG